MLPEVGPTMPGYVFEPFRIKSVEAIPVTTREQRTEALAGAGYNVFKLPAELVTIDLLTDSGTTAMSDRQWAALMTGDESYAGSRSFEHLREAVLGHFGFPYVVPVHQGRAGEHVLFGALLRPGDVVPTNQPFDTTRANIEAGGAHAAELVIPEGREPAHRHPFKGNVDLGALRALLDRQRVPFMVVTVTNNSGGGQPVSLANLRAVRDLLRERGVPLYLDAARHAENAWLIQQREAACAHMSVAEIVRAVFDCADGFLMSAKKDGMVNIGGLVGLRDPDLYERVCQRLILLEGFPTYGGLAGRDLAALAAGLGEALDERYLAYRVGQVAYLAGRLLEAGVPIVEPPGGHAVFLDARRFLPHLPQAHLPALALVNELYLEAGVRGVEVGGVMFGRTDPATGRAQWPALELVRLAIPRRVYTQSHLDCVADAVVNVHGRRSGVTGYRFTHAPQVLRHFTAAFAPLGAGVSAPAPAP